MQMHTILFYLLTVIFLIKSQLANCRAKLQTGIAAYIVHITTFIGVDRYHVQCCGEEGQHKMRRKLSVTCPSLNLMACHFQPNV